MNIGCAVHADEALEHALRRGRLVRSDDVSSWTYPDAARTYLSDGTGIAWDVSDDLPPGTSVAVDAEIPHPVRASLRRRFGIDEPRDFARRWTRAEALAKLDGLPIITWLSRHGLDVPSDVEHTTAESETAWRTIDSGDTVMTFALRLARGHTP